MPFINANGLRLYYEEYGDPHGSPPLLLIPGLGGSHLSWAAVARRLPYRRRVMAIDPRDAGKSDRAKAPYTIADMARDVVGLQDALRIPTADIAGLSMGGAIAQELAIAYPERVRRLVLIATYDAGDPRGTAIFEHLGRLRGMLSREDYARTLLPWVYTHGEVQSAAWLDAAVAAVTADPLYQAMDAYERQARATVSFRSRERLGRIAAPTLLVFGDEDLFTPMRFARSLEAGIPGARLAILAGAGHGLVWTRSAEVAALIESFL